METNLKTLELETFYDMTNLRYLQKYGKIYLCNVTPTLKISMLYRALRRNTYATQKTF